MADALSWRVERACAAAFPARDRHVIDGWSVGVSGGGPRRINSASVIDPAAPRDRATLATIHALFAAAGQPTIVRVTDLADVTDLLDTAGFTPPEGRTRTLLRAAGTVVTSATAVTLASTPDPAWLAARSRLSALDHRATAARITAPAAYARIDHDGATVAIGYAALTDGIAVIEAIATDAAARRRGQASAIVAALCDWAARGGADHIALQVEEANAAARALYDRLGFVTDLYGYHYRRSAPCPTPV